VTDTHKGLRHGESEKDAKGLYAPGKRQSSRKFVQTKLILAFIMVIRPERRQGYPPYRSEIRSRTD
jgi:hypothetical protein